MKKLNAKQLISKSGLTWEDLNLLEEYRILVPNGRGTYREKLVSWAQRLAYLLDEGWDVTEIKRWARDRWNTANPTQWPPDREMWIEDTYEPM